MSVLTFPFIFSSEIIAAFSPRHIIPYDDKTKIPVVLSDVKRKIYFDENFATKNVLSFCIRFSDVIIWLTSDVDFISDVPDINVIQSLMDMTSYWLSESREIIERMDLMYSILCATFLANST